MSNQRGLFGTIGAAIRFFILTPLARLRFVIILFAIGAVLINWDRIISHYEKMTRPQNVAEAATADTEYYCPMHPTVIREDNKEKCPICFMPLSKRKKGDVSEVTLPAGTISRLQLSPYRIALANVKTTKVEYHQLGRELPTVGTVEFNERELKHVAARFKGRIEKLFVNQTGQRVQKGDPLASLYSPDLVVTVQNLLDARRSGNPELEQNSRDRLKLWGIENSQINEILKTGTPITQLTIRSPIDGHVIRKFAREGQYLEEGGALYDLADLGTVWVQAQLYEDDLAYLPKNFQDAKSDQFAKPIAATATFKSLPGKTFPGNLTFALPSMERETRTLMVRFEIANADHQLRPGMSALIKMNIGAEQLPDISVGQPMKFQDGKVLAVPEGCVIDTGATKIVYRQELPGVFDGIRVELGPKLTNSEGVVFYPVLSGLEAGNELVTSGAFLIDAETRLNPAAGSIYIGGSSGKPNPTVRPTTPMDEEATILAALRKLSPADRKLAEAQRECPVIEGSRLGSMGVPIKLVLDGQPVFVCCAGCTAKAKRDPGKTLKRVEELKKKPKSPQASPLASIEAKAKEAEAKVEEAKAEEARIRTGLGKLPPEDRKLAELQRICPVTGERLGSMGKPMKMILNGKTIFICCKGCDEDVLADPETMLKKILK